MVPKKLGLKPNILGPHGPIRRSPNGSMKRRKQWNKRKERGRGRGTADQGEKKRERERMGLKPLLYRPLGHPDVFSFHLFSENPLPVDVGIIGRTTSNIV